MAKQVLPLPLALLIMRFKHEKDYINEDKEFKIIDLLKVIIGAGIVVALYAFIVNNVFASTVLSDGFETYSLGVDIGDYDANDIFVGGDWLVNSTDKFLGDKSIRDNSSDISLIFATTTDLTISLWFKDTGSDPDYTRIRFRNYLDGVYQNSEIIYQDYPSSPSTDCNLGTGGWLMIYNDTTASCVLPNTDLTYYEAYTRGDWVNLSIKIADGKTYYSLDGADYITNKYIGETNEIKIDISNGGSSYFYIDSLVVSDNTESDVEIIDISNPFANLGLNNLETVNWLNCYTGTGCHWWFSFNEGSVGYDVYAVPDTVLQQNPGFAYASTTIVSFPGDQNAVVMPDYAEGTQFDACLCLTDTDEYCSEGLFCGTTINYIATSSLITGLTQDILITDCNDIDPCGELTAPTSTDSWLDVFSIDQMTYTLNCGLRKVGNWAFCPSEEAQIEISGTLYELSNSFPITIYNQAVGSLQDIQEATTTASIPLMYWEIGQTEATEIGNIYDSEEFKQNTFYDIYKNYVYVMIEYLIYFGLVMYIIYRIVGISHKQKT